MKEELFVIEEKLQVLRDCIHNLDCDMPLSDEESGEYIFLSIEACDSIQESIDKIRNASVM
jgi:hypothetical protein